MIHKQIESRFGVSYRAGNWRTPSTFSDYLVYIIRISGSSVHLNGWAPAELEKGANMATMIKIYFGALKGGYAHTSIQRWAERQGGAAFVSFDDSFVLTDYSHEHREVGLLLHILNCNKLSYRCVSNIDLDEISETIYLNALKGKNNNNKKGA